MFFQKVKGKTLLIWLSADRKESFERSEGREKHHRGQVLFVVFEVFGEEFRFAGAALNNS